MALRCCYCGVQKGGRHKKQCEWRRAYEIKVVTAVHCDEDNEQEAVARRFDGKVVVTETGARRGTECDGIPLWMLPITALQSWAEAFAEGSKKYGVHNWLRGFKVSGLLTHALVHIYQYLSGCRKEDHLGHAMWNIGTAIHMTKTRPDMCDTLTEEKIREFQNRQQGLSEELHAKHDRGDKRFAKNRRRHAKDGGKKRKSGSR